MQQFFMLSVYKFLLLFVIYYLTQKMSIYKTLDSRQLEPRKWYLPSPTQNVFMYFMFFSNGSDHIFYIALQ